MRTSIAFASVLALAACGTDHKNPNGGADSNGGAMAVIDEQSQDITLTPGQEVTYCWYFHTKNTAPVAINKWVSDMTPGSHHMILFTGGPNHPDGLDMTNSCGLGTSTSNPPVWVYASQVPQQEEDLPSDDGTGKPLAQNIAPNTEGAIQMHYLNASDSTIMAHVHLQGFALPAGAAFTETDAYITYNQAISIPPGATNFKVTASCNLPTGVKFWTVSTHEHKQGIGAAINDGTTQIFSTTDWEHPGAKNWMTTPFYTFTSPTLTWECTYNNTGSNAAMTVVAGPSAATNEMCMAVGYFFPATGPFFGLNANFGGNTQCFTQEFLGSPRGTPTP
jgi:hypothetical protein